MPSCYWHLLKVHFRSKPFYIDIVDLFHQSNYQKEMDQLIDLITAPEDNVDLNEFSLERHRLIVIYKTAYYSFYLPVACAMLHFLIPESYPPPSVLTTSLSRFSSLSESTSRSKTTFWTLQARQNRKNRDRHSQYKCSWVINTALSIASPERRKILDENYRRKDAEKESNVKAIFEDLRIREIYADYEEKVVATLKQKISSVVEVDGGLKRDVFEGFLAKIYKRTK